MKVIVDSVLRLEDVPEKLLNKIKSELTIKNLTYFRKLVMGIPVYGEPKFIRLWSERVINKDKQYILPRGYYARLWEIAGNIMKVSDIRVLRTNVEFPKKPNLRDYQQPAVAKAMNWQQGVILMPCGSGKTETALGIVAEIGQPTLWITHTMDLLKQSMDRAHSRLGLSGKQIGIIQGDNNSIGSHMTFATVQTLVKRDLSEIKNQFGCIVIDEAHLVFKDAAKARMFESVVSQFPAFYRFGITASEHRSDGLIDTMFDVIGPKIYEVTQDDLNKAGNIVVPQIKFIETEFEYLLPYGEMLNVQRMIRTMRESGHRNDILFDVLDQAIKDNDYALVLGDSLEHLEMLKNSVECVLKRATAFVCGTTKKQEREKIMADMRTGRYRYLFATYQLAKLGLDIPRLNKLILATPKRDKTSIQQAVGRIMRPFENKGTPVVYDIWDSKIPQMRYWAKDRVKVYRALGCEIIGGPKVRR